VTQIVSGTYFTTNEAANARYPKIDITSKTSTDRERLDMLTGLLLGRP
jgi:hypothetical protein